VRKLQALIWLLILILVACAPKGAYQDVTADELYAQLGKKDVLIVDVRTPGEYREGHIYGAVNYPLDRIGEWYRDLPRNEPVYLYCHSGNRSREAAEYLKKKGFKNIYNVTGGIIAWTKRSYPLVR